MTTQATRFHTYPISNQFIEADRKSMKFRERDFDVVPVFTVQVIQAEESSWSKLADMVAGVTAALGPYEGVFSVISFLWGMYKEAEAKKAAERLRQDTIKQIVTQVGEMLRDLQSNLINYISAQNFDRLNGMISGAELLLYDLGGLKATYDESTDSEQKAAIMLRIDEKIEYLINNTTFFVMGELYNYASTPTVGIQRSLAAMPLLIRALVFRNSVMLLSQTVDYKQRIREVSSSVLGLFPAILDTAKKLNKDIHSELLYQEFVDYQTPYAYEHIYYYKGRYTAFRGLFKNNDLVAYKKNFQNYQLLIEQRYKEMVKDVVAAEAKLRESIAQI